MYGLFHYNRPYSFNNISKDILALEDAKKLGNEEMLALNYLFNNSYITKEETKLLANQLTHWQGRIIAFHEENLFLTSKFFTSDHADALISLIQDKRVATENAIATIQDLTTDQARRIANGQTREEVITDQLSQRIGLR